MKILTKNKIQKLLSVLKTNSFCDHEILENFIKNWYEIVAKWQLDWANITIHYNQDQSYEIHFKQLNLTVINANLDRLGLTKTTWKSQLVTSYFQLINLIKQANLNLKWEFNYDANKLLTCWFNQDNHTYLLVFKESDAVEQIIKAFTNCYNYYLKPNHYLNQELFEQQDFDTITFTFNCKQENLTIALYNDQKQPDQPLYQIDHLVLSAYCQLPPVFNQS